MPCLPWLKDYDLIARIRALVPCALANDLQRLYFRMGAL